MSLRHAILGFLATSPMTGYDLRKHMEVSVAHFWPADQAQIYRTLAKLVQDGLVEVHVIPQHDKPNRHEHHILPAGIAELDRWLASSTEYEPTREPFLLQVFFGGRLGPEHVGRLLAQRRHDAEQLLAALRAVERGASEAPERQHLSLEQRLRLATLANGIAHAEAELKWIDEVGETLGAYQ